MVDEVGIKGEFGTDRHGIVDGVIDPDAVLEEKAGSVITGTAEAPEADVW